MSTNTKSSQPHQALHFVLYLTVEALANVWALFNFKHQL